MVLNCDLIESVEAAPDTIIRLTNGKSIVAKETVKEIVERIIEFKRRIHFVGVFDGMEPESRSPEERQ